MRASAKGAKIYEGRPCKHGHDGLRYASNRACVVCSRDSPWQLEHHRESNRKAALRYHVKHRRRCNEQRRQWHRKRRAELHKENL